MSLTPRSALFRSALSTACLLVWASGCGSVTRPSSAEQDAERLIVVGEGGVYTSLNGLAWTKQDSAASYGLTSVVAGDDAVIAVGYGVLLSSPDGRAWTDATPEDGANVTFEDVAYARGRFYVVGEIISAAPPPNDLSPKVLVSASAGGRDWTELRNPDDLISFTSIASQGDVVVASYREEGGDGWSTSIASLDADDDEWIHEYGPSDDIYLQVDGTSDSVLATGACTILEKDADAAWAEVGTPGSCLTTPFGAVVEGDGIVVAVGDGDAAVLADGVWQAHAMPEGRWRDVAYANGRFVAVGVRVGESDSGIIAVSEDGVTWTEVDADMPALRGVASMNVR